MSSGSEPIGYAVVNGVTAPITSFSMHSGKLWFTAVVSGPLKAASGPVTLFGADLQGICQGGETEGWRNVGPDEVLKFSISMVMDQCE